MTDIYDQATDLEERYRAEAIARQAEKAPAAGDWRKLSAKWCEAPGCGERILDERRRAVPGVRFCVECQAMAEQEERRRR